MASPSLTPAFVFLMEKSEGEKIFFSIKRGGGKWENQTKKVKEGTTHTLHREQIREKGEGYEPESREKGRSKERKRLIREGRD